MTDINCSHPVKGVLACLAVLAVMIGLSAPATAADGLGKAVDFQGQPVFYMDYGQGDEAVVLVHCWTCNHTFWRLQIPALAKKMRVIAPDLPGHGLSGKPKIDYTQPHFAEALSAVIEHTGVKKVVLVGHSMGSVVTRQYALKHPDKIKGYVIVDGVLEDVPEDEAGRLEWVKRFKEFAGMLSGPKGEENTTKFIMSLFVPATPKAVMKEVRDKMLETPRYVAESAMASMGDETLWKDDEIIPAPTLAVYAQNQWLPPDFEQTLKKFHPNYDYRVWEGVSHFFMLERPEELNALLLEFLEKLK